jgi:hypothetical protein
MLTLALPLQLVYNNWKKPGQLITETILLLSQAPQGVYVVSKRFPSVKIVTSEIEFGLNDDFRVVPGMGEFGDRYFGTDDYQSSTPFFCDDKNHVRWAIVSFASRCGLSSDLSLHVTSTIFVTEGWPHSC